MLQDQLPDHRRQTLLCANSQEIRWIYLIVSALSIANFWASDMMSNCLVVGPLLDYRRSQSDFVPTSSKCIYFLIKFN